MSLAIPESLIRSIPFLVVRAIEAGYSLKKLFDEAESAGEITAETKAKLLAEWDATITGWRQTT